MKYCEQLEVSIALAGEAGHSTDWLDVLVEHGRDAVRSGILASSIFRPTPDERDAARETRQRKVRLAEIEAAYPAPILDRLTLQYDFTAAGKIRLHKVAKIQAPTGEWVEESTPLLTPFSIRAKLRHADMADAYGLRCMVQDMNGRPRAVDFDRAALARMGASDIRAMLYEAGLRTGSGGEKIDVECLKAADPDQEILVVQRPGWSELGGRHDPIFMTPSGSEIGAPDGLHLELAAAARMAPDVARAGSMEGGTCFAF